MTPMRRVLVGELMDEPGVAREELDAALRYIRTVNDRFGGSRALLAHLERWSHRWPKDRPVTMLDVGTGSADIPLAARAWASAAGFDLRITAIDLHETTLELAREHVASNPEFGKGISLVRADALKLDEVFAPGSFDYAHAGMFLHHLSDAQVETALDGMDRVARAGLVWNDLNRSRLHHAIVSMMVAGKPRMVAHDARVSVAAGFTRRECEAMAQRLGLGYLRYQRAVLWYRFTMAGEKPGSWV